MPYPLRSILPLLLLAATALGAAEGRGASFQGVGDLAGGAFFSQALGVSPSGEWVVGASEVSFANLPAGPKTEAFRWSDASLEGLGRVTTIEVTLPGVSVGTTAASTARAIANDGDTAVGDACMTLDDPACASGLCPCAPVAFAGGALVPLNLGSYAGSSDIYTGGAGLDVTADGAQALFTEQLTGPTFDPSTTLLLGDASTIAWSTGGGLFDEFFGGAVSPEAGWVTYTISGLGGFGSLLQSPSGGPATLLDLDVSHDVTGLGLEVAGEKGSEAALWKEGATTLLGDLSGGTSRSAALGAADGGHTVVGWGTTASGEEAFLWTPGDGMRRLADVLTDAGLDLTGWTLIRATGISASGRTIVGWGSNPNGDTEGFVARLAPEPLATPSLGPFGALLLGATLLALGLRGARRS